MKAACCAVLCVLYTALFALEPRYNIVPEQMNTANVTFKTVNNLIVFKLTINDSDTLHFILDSGAKNTVLFVKDPAGNPLNKRDLTPVSLRGIGVERDSIKAFISKNNEINLPGIEGRFVDIAFVYSRDFDVSSYLGCRVDGIIGSDLFEQFVVRINYSRHEITFHNPGTEIIQDRYLSLPLEIQNGKAYVHLPVKAGKHYINAKLLLDLGESKPISLIPGTDPSLNFPEKYTLSSLGIGLNGTISGYIARLPSLQIGPYYLNNVIAAYPDEESIPRMQLSDGRNGSLGAGILERFECVIDFPGKKLHLLKIGNLKKPFLYNRLGAELVAEGKNFTDLYIAHIIPLTPAAMYGLQQGDRVLAVNGRKTKDRTLDDVWQWINSEKNEEIILKIRRNGEVHELNINLFDIL